MNSSKIKTKLKSVFSPFFITSACVLIFGLVIRFIAGKSAAFADLWQSSIASVPRGALAYLTNLFPFSVAEFLFLTLPLTLAILLRIGSRRSSTWAETFRYTFNLIGVCALVFAMLLVNFSAGYCTTPLDKRIGAERSKVSAQELYDTAESILKDMSGCIDDVDFIYGDSSVMPYSHNEMVKKLNEAYKKARLKYPFLSGFTSNPKQVMISEPWTYTHIAGVYTFFTGEANINVNFPDYTLPYTTAHEMAHQRGISREDEANFMAFLVCLESDDSYIRYSACASVFEYVASSLYSADKELYKKLYVADVPRSLKNEMSAYNEFFEKYRENKVAEVSGAINNGYLQSQGQKEGTKSYGLVVDLLVAYYKK